MVAGPVGDEPGAIAKRRSEDRRRGVPNVDRHTIHDVLHILLGPQEEPVSQRGRRPLARGQGDPHVDDSPEAGVDHQRVAWRWDRVRVHDDVRKIGALMSRDRGGLVR